jgi:hypothetical protein
VSYVSRVPFFSCAGVRLFHLLGVRFSGQENPRSAFTLHRHYRRGETINLLLAGDFNGNRKTPSEGCSGGYCWTAEAVPAYAMRGGKYDTGQSFFVIRSVPFRTVF